MKVLRKLNWRKTPQKRKEKIKKKDEEKKRERDNRVSYQTKFVPLRGITPYPQNVEKSIVTGDDYECCNSYYRPGTEIWFCAPVSFLVSRLWPAPWIRNSLENTVTPSADTSGCTWSGNRAPWEKYNWINKLPRNLAANLFTPTTATSTAEVESIKWPIHPRISSILVHDFHHYIIRQISPYFSIFLFLSIITFYYSYNFILAIGSDQGIFKYYNLVFLFILFVVI